MKATVKFRGGPLAGKYQFVEVLGERLVVTKPQPQWANMLGVDDYGDPFSGPAYKTVTGFYAQTNIRTKKGNYVFQWMGWEGEVISR